MSFVACSLLGLAIAGSSSASTTELDSGLASARAALVSGKPKAALSALEGAEEVAQQAGVLVPARSVASIFYLRGVAHRATGDRKEKATDLWRAALVVDNELVWDESLIDDGDAFSLFEALRGEVRGRQSVDVGVPEALGAAKAYVDGVRVRAGDTVLKGSHLAQITCDDGAIPGAWTTFSRPLNWVKLCPNGIDTTVVVTDDDDDDDLFGGMLPDFGDDGDESDPPPAEQPPSPPVASASRSLKPLPIGLMVGGGALVTTGVVLNFAKAAPAWTALEDARANPTSVTSANDDDLSSTFQSARLLTLATGGVGLGLLATGVVLQVRSVSVMPAPGGFWLHGSF